MVIYLWDCQIVVSLEDIADPLEVGRSSLGYDSVIRVEFDPTFILTQRLTLRNNLRGDIKLIVLVHILTINLTE